MSKAARKLCSSVTDCKQTAATSCEGCSLPFCVKHFIDHRNVLSEHMSGIMNDYNILKSTLSESAANNSHPFLANIDEWEQESIVKIKQKSQELREELFRLTAIRKDEVSKVIQQTSTELNERQENENFLEVDLENWKTTLSNVKAKLDLSSIFAFNIGDDLPVIQNISVIITIENELFDQVFDITAQIKDKGQVAVHDASYNYNEIRGRNEYTNGRHKIRLCIEQSADSWMFLGINSKPTLLQKQSTSSKSAYGWSSNNYFWLNGECQPNKSLARIEMKTNDVIYLIFDCKNHKISMVNERTHAKYELVVNLDFCPFPWQLHINLYEANSRIRILSA